MSILSPQNFGMCPDSRDQELPFPDFRDPQSLDKGVGHRPERF